MIYSRALKAAEFVEDIFAEAETGIFLGTGLGGSVDFMRVIESVPYSEIPHFPISTVESHAGEMIFGEISGKKVIVMKGRFHLYEGYTADQVSFPVRLMQVLGVKNLIVTNSSGGLNLSFKPGDLMVIEDHINLTGENPLVGVNDENLGPRFPDMSQTYDKGLRDLVFEAGEELGIYVHKGVYAGLKGPSLETPAENRFLRTIGADAVGLSTVCEVIAGRHAGMRVLGMSIITNINNPDEPEEAKIDDIIQVANDSAEKLENILKLIIRKL
ncbi:MAG: purine-nucleoside phosphorylase [Desulforegulaceae bacterium]|nr:purine-nucleoside phosphorylase [Desulforegulaceae bacterium]